MGVSKHWTCVYFCVEEYTYTNMKLWNIKCEIIKKKWNEDRQFNHGIFTHFKKNDFCVVL